MKFIHISDLHLGKRVNEFSMIEDQDYILKKILEIIDEEKPDSLIIAGDIYDKAVPSAEAVALFDDFLVSLSRRKLQVFIISGNHDSAERIAFGGRLMDARGIHLAPVYNGTIAPVRLTDEYGGINIYMLPFIKPSHVRVFFPDNEITSYTQAIKTTIDSINLNRDERNILVTHQFVTGSTSSGSEELSAGGTDNVDADVFKDFDYVALGHIHRSQKCGSEKIRYSGTPLKYSFSESKDIKYVTIVNMNEKGSWDYSLIPLVPKRDMVEIKGTYNELMLKSFYENTSYQQDYVHVTLTDEDDVPDALARLRVVYKNIMKLDYDNTRTKNNTILKEIEDVKSKSPYELFSEFFHTQNGMEMSESQADIIRKTVDEIWEVCK